MRFTVKDDEGNIIAGLERIEAGNAILLRIAPSVPLQELEVGQTCAALAMDKARIQVTREA